MKLNEIVERKASDLEEVQDYRSGDLDISSYDLTSLEGCPKEVTGDFDCRDNQLTSFEYFPKFIGGNCFISANRFKFFKDIDKHIEYIGYSIYADEMNISSGFSDLFGINGLRLISIDHDEISDIVNKYLPEKDLINFQDEMIKAGYESWL